MALIVRNGTHTQVSDWYDETIRMYYGETTNKVRMISPAAQPAISAERVANEIMSRIERDGAIHKSSLIDVLSMLGIPTQGSGA